MHVKFTAAVLLAVASAVAFAQQSQNPFVGRWNLRGTGVDTDKVYWLEVTQKGDQLEGRFLDRSAHATPLAWVRVEGDHARVSFRKMVVTPITKSGT